MRTITALSRARTRAATDSTTAASRMPFTKRITTRIRASSTRNSSTRGRHTCFAPGRHDVAEAHALLLGEVAGTRRDDTILGDDGPPLPGRCGERGGPDRHAVEIVDEAQTVRPEQGDVAVARQRGQLLLAVSHRRAGHGGSRRQDHRARDAGLVEVPERIGNRGRRDHEQRSIDVLADRGAGAGCGLAVDQSALRIDDVDAPPEAEIDAVPERDAGPGRTPGCTDQRDRTGVEKRSQSRPDGSSSEDRLRHR
ncbi:MAG: hypothetical protein U1F14_04500 [Steroidobacteraceae bacterium]